MDEPSENYDKCIMTGYFNSSQKSVECYLTAGKKVWLKIRGISSSSNAEMKVTKAGDAIKPLPAEAVIVEAGKTAWYSYEVTESGRYDFTCSTTGGSADLNLYADMEKQVPINIGSSKERYWKSGSTVYLKLTNIGTTDAQVTVKTDKAAPEAWTDITAEQTIEGSAAKWYAFTAAEEGMVKFSNTSGYIDVYTKEMFEAEKTFDARYNSTATYPFAQGETVYLKVYSYYNNMTVKAEKTALQVIADGENTVEVANGSALIKFTAPKAGIYTFEPNNNNAASKGNLYLYEDKESYAENTHKQYAYSGDPICYPLIKGAEVYLKISSYNNAEYTLTVSSEEMQEVKKGANPLTLTAGEDKWLYYAVADDAESQYTYVSYISADNIINSLYCRYNFSFDSNSWKDSMNGGCTMHNNSSYSNGLYHSNSKMLIIELKPDNSGTITFKISDESN